MNEGRWVGIVAGASIELERKVVCSDRHGDNCGGKSDPDHDLPYKEICQKLHKTKGG